MSIEDEDSRIERILNDLNYHEKEYLRDLKRKKYTDFSCQVIPKLKNKIFTFQTNNFFLDIGSPHNYKFLKKYFASKSI